MLKTLKRLISPQKTDFSSAQRNDPCPCGSGKKFKACHQDEIRTKQREEVLSRQFRNPRG